MNVLYVLHDSSLGGAIQSFLDMVCILKEHITPIVMVPYAGSACEVLEDMGIQYYVFPYKVDYGKIGSFNQRKRDINVCENYHIAESVINFFFTRDVRIDIVHTNSSVNNIGAIIALMLGVPHIWHFRELITEGLGMELCDDELQNELLKISDYRIAVSDCVKEICEKKYNVSFSRLYNGLNVNRYICKQKTLDVNKNIYMAGTIGEWKGQEDAVRSICYLVKQQKELGLVLHLVGYGDERLLWLIKKYITKNKLEKNIIIHDFIYDFAQIRDKCSIYLTCSWMEGLGRSTIEAMMARKLVIGSDKGGTVEIVGGNSQRGLLYKGGDVDDLSQKILKAIHMSIQEYNDYLDRAQQFSVDTFDNRSYSAKIFELYSSVLGKAFSSDYRKKELEKIRERVVRAETEFNTENTYNSDDISKKTDLLLHKWSSRRQNGNSLKECFLNKGINSIAIYGFSQLGRMLYDELDETPISIKYFIDKNYVEKLGVLKVFKPTGMLPDVDCIIVSIVGSEHEIIREYEGIISIPMIGISDVIYEW